MNDRPDSAPAAVADLPGAGGALAWAACGALLAAQGQGLAVKEAGGGRYLYANEVLLSWIGRPLAEVVGRTDADLFDAGTQAALRTADQAALAQEGVMAAEHRLSLGGRARELTLWRLAFAGEPAGCAGGSDGSRLLLGVWSDVAARKQQETQARAVLAQIEQLQTANDALQRELAGQSMRDPASGLYAKAHFEDQLRREVDLSSREHREFSIVLVEIDEAGTAGTGEAPDAAGRTAAQGQRAVQAALGRLLRSGTRAMDAACRLDERRFAVLLSGVGLATAHSRMEGLRRQCATEIVVHEGQELRFTVAMGVASFPHTAHSQPELLDACAAALLEAKRRGGNHVALAAIRFEPA
ncbi:MAG: diguanylate cyclase [Rubrivivax sp.]|nr:diguanylate cyclase [Rubrivivax sp.]